MTTIAQDWMPDAAMRRIHLHWSAGQYTPNATDLKHYHILVRGDGKLARGNRSIADNAPGKPASGMAAHTLNANTGAIGVSICSMVGAREAPFDPGPAPMTRLQWDTAIAVVAILARRYGIAVTPRTILTHAEIQPNLNIMQRQKWDITRLAFDPAIRGHGPVGDRMRREVAAQLDAAPGAVVAPPTDPELRLPKYKVTGVAPSRLNFRRNPEGEVVGALAEGTRVERLAVVDGWWRVRIASGHVGWVWSSFLTAV